MKLLHWNSFLKPSISLNSFFIFDLYELNNHNRIYWHEKSNEWENSRWRIIKIKWKRWSYFQYYELINTVQSSPFRENEREKKRNLFTLLQIMFTVSTTLLLLLLLLYIYCANGNEQQHNKSLTMLNWHYPNTFIQINRQFMSNEWEK